MWNFVYHIIIEKETLIYLRNQQQHILGNFNYNSFPQFEGLLKSDTYKYKWRLSVSE